MTPRTGFAIAGILFCIAGLFSALSKNVTQSGAFISLGMMFVVLSLTRH